MRLKQIISLLKHLLAREFGVRADQILETEVLSTAKKITKLYDRKTPVVRLCKPRKGPIKVFRA